MIHGKQGLPDGNLAGISQTIEKAGFPVERPSMCWARARIYDRTLPDCMADVDAAIGRLKSRGATAIVVAGHSLGGAGALLYGSLHDDLKGVIALAPAPPPGYARNPTIAASAAKAQSLVAAGRGDEMTTFQDINTSIHGNVTFEVRTTPTIFLSFADMSGPANLVRDASNVKVPVLWVSGTADRTQLPREAGFDRIPANPLSLYLQVKAGHMDTPDVAASAIVAWLKRLAQAP